MDIEVLIGVALEQEASDFHLSTGKAVYMRAGHNMMPYQPENVSTLEEIEKFLMNVLDEPQKKELKEKRQVDFVYPSATGIRLRGNAFFEQNGVSVSLRIIPQDIRPFEGLGFPDFVMEKLKTLKQGLVLVVGPTGEGKSTTLASVLKKRSEEMKEHIITIEDPIEYILPSGSSIVHQREVGKDVMSFQDGIIGALREDPDTMMVGELRDMETIRAALTMTETGHVVFGTLHTKSGPETVSRIIDVFPAGEQDQVRNQLAASLAMVISQRLVPMKDNPRGRVMAYEIMTNNYAIASYIRQKKIFQIPNVIQTDNSGEMIQLEQSLAGLVMSGQVELETAIEYAQNPDNLRSILVSNGVNV